MNIFSFGVEFSSEADFSAHFKAERDKIGVTCKCINTDFFWIKSRLSYECKSCKKRITLNSETIMENSNVFFLIWHKTIFLMSGTKKGLSAKEMQKQLGLKRYEPVWAMMHKLRKAMGKRDDQYTLEGMIEMDEGYFTVESTEIEQQKGMRGSGYDFEKITANDPIFGALFNVSNNNNSVKNRSDNKGPEPEGITIGQINGATYAFITLERIGGLMTYDITNPAAPTFVSYKNNRTLTTVGGDLGPEGIIYISPANSPLSTGLVVMANEVSSTLSFYQITNDVLSNTGFDSNGTSFLAYPNPVTNGIVYFNRMVSVSLFDLSGRKITEKQDVSQLDMNYPAGIYLLKTNEGLVQKVSIK